MLRTLAIAGALAATACTGEQAGGRKITCCPPSAHRRVDGFYPFAQRLPAQRLGG